MARAGTRRPVVEAAAGTQTRVIPTNGEGIGLAHIGHPTHFYGFWGPPAAWGVPYIGWGVPYVPYRYYGDWGALWYPYAEWRGPHGGWGNP
jgi:hypothetical protein